MRLGKDRFIAMFWPETNYKDRFIAMFHLKMVMWRMYRNLLQGFGWTNAMAQAEIVLSAGIADSLQRASHIMRITHANKMTASKFAITLPQILLLIFTVQTLICPYALSGH